MDKNVIVLKKKLKRQKVSGIALDIDETLAATGLHWIEIIEKKFGINPEGLSALDIIQKYTVVQNAPYWQTKELQKWLNEARSSEKMHFEVSLIENSNHFANKLNAIIPVVAYATVRLRTLQDVTEKWLANHDFPQAEVITRPSAFQHDKGDVWKAKIVSYLYPQVLGIVDDNPGILDFLPEDYKGHIFVYKKTFKYSGKLNVVVCPTWEDVLINASRVFK